jgi:tripartite-type tricarboxylate transporter receptor subunit TctC
MKKLILALLSTLSFSVLAQETVTLVYAFGVSDKQANYYRNLAQEANASQKKYNFIFDVKPGAGSTVAARHVLVTPNTILGTSAAHFIRPNFFPNESHNIDEYQSLLPLCEIPIIVASAKYKTWQEVPKDRPLTTTIYGMGSATHLISLQVKTQYPQLEPVPYKGAGDAIPNVVSGMVDFYVGFISDVSQFPSITVLGTTGSARSGKYPTLIENKFPQVLAGMDNPQHMVVPASLDPKKYQEWRDILSKAAKSVSVRESFAPDFCKPMDVADTKSWYKNQKEYWKKISSTVSLDK